MSEIAVVAYHKQLNGKSLKLFSVESNRKTTLEHDLAEMLLILERKININPMLITKYIMVSKGRQNDFVESINCILHPEDFKPNEEKLKSITIRQTTNLLGCD